MNLNTDTVSQDAPVDNATVGNVGDTPPVDISKTVDTPVLGDWRSSFAEDLRNDPTISKYKTPEEAAKGLVNQAKLIGKDKVVIPKEGDSDEIYESWKKANGRPDSPDGYEINMPENISIGDEMKASYFGKFHEIGLNNGQIQAIMDLRSEELSVIATQKQAVEDETFNQGVSALRKELGANYDDMLTKAHNVAKTFLGEEVVQLLTEKNIHNDPRVAKGLMNIAKAIGNDKFITPENVDMTPARATEEIARIKGGAAYWDQMHTEHDSAKSRVKDLLDFQ